MIKSRRGIIAALAVLCCCSQAEAGDATTAKLMADRPGSQGPEWILYEDLPEDGEIVSFNKVGDDGVEFQVCQSEDGDIGTVSQMQGGAVCETREGEEDTFYVLILGEQVDDDDEADDEAGGGIADALRKKRSKKNMANDGGGGMMPDFDWSEEEMIEISNAVNEAVNETDAWQRFLEEGPEAGGDKKGFWRDIDDQPTFDNYYEWLSYRMATRRCGGAAFKVKNYWRCGE